MCDNETPISTHNQWGSIRSIQRLDVLGRRFSEAEIQRLSTLQRDYQEQPDTLDLPIEVLRLRFARWLVERGCLGADDGSGFEKTRGDGDTPCERWASSEGPNPHGGVPSGEPCGKRDDEPERERAPEQHRPDRRFSLLAFWSRVRRDVARAAGIDREAEGRQDRSADAKPCGPESPDGPCGPYSPYSPYPGADSHSEAQWYWIFLRHPF